LGLAPGLGGDFGYLSVGHLRQASQYVPKISVRVQASTAAAFNHRIKDRTAVSDGGFSHEEPVFLAQRRGPNGIFDQVVVEL
jgi:hypothetical protein